MTLDVNPPRRILLADGGVIDQIYKVDHQGVEPGDG
jgi:hypothetical protein